MAQSNEKLSDASEPLEVQRIKRSIYRVSDIINAPSNSLAVESGEVQSSALPEEPRPWQVREYSSDEGINYGGRFYPYSGYPESAWSQLATHNEIIYPYIICIGDWRAQRSAMLLRLHFPMIRLNYYSMVEFDLEELSRLVKGCVRMKGKSPMLIMTFTHLEESFKLEINIREDIPFLRSREMGSPEILANAIYQSLSNLLTDLPDAQFVFVVPHAVHFYEYNKVTKRTASENFQISPRSLDFRPKLKNKMMDERRNFNYFWATFRSVSSTLRRQGSYNNFFTLPQIPFMRNKHYNASERYYFAFHFRRMQYNTTIWLLDDTLHLRDSSVREVLSLTLFSFARFEERHGRPIHPELMMRLFHSGILYGFSAWPAPNSFLGFPPTFNKNQNISNIQAAVIPEGKEDSNHVTGKEDNDLFKQSYNDIFKDFITDFDANNPEHRKNIEDHEVSCQLKNLSSSVFYRDRSKKVKKNPPTTSKKKRKCKEDLGNSIPSSSGLRFRRRAGNSSEDMTTVIVPSTSSVPSFYPEAVLTPSESPIFHLTERRIHQFLRPIQPERNSNADLPESTPFYQSVDHQTIGIQSHHHSTSTKDKNTGAIPKRRYELVEFPKDLADVELDPGLSKKSSEGFGVSRHGKYNLPELEREPKKSKPKPPGKVILQRDQIPSHLRMLCQNPEQQILLEELGLRVADANIPEIRRLAGDRRRATYLRRKMILKEVQSTKEMRITLLNYIRDVSVKMKRLGVSWLPKLFQRTDLPQLSKLLTTTHSLEADAREREGREAAASDPLIPEGLEDVSSEEETEGPCPPPYPLAVESTSSDILKEMLEDISSDEDL